MGKVVEEGVTPSLARFIANQPVFFVGTANNNVNDDNNTTKQSATTSSRINLSPKSPGYSLQVLDPFTVAYADLSGSGSETAAHLLQNSRITVMFVNLQPDSPPRILRLYGTARIVLPRDAVETGLVDCFPSRLTAEHPGWRAVYVVDVDRVSTSCGFSMPKMRFESYRTTLDETINRMEREGFKDNEGKLHSGGMDEYRRRGNAFSIDGLPSIALLGKDAVPVKMMPGDGYNFATEISKTDGDAELKRAKALLARANKSPHVITAENTKEYERLQCYNRLPRRTKTCSRCCRTRRNRESTKEVRRLVLSCSF